MAGPIKAVFLDRDGVINRTVLRGGEQRPPQDLGEWAWMDGVHATLRELSARGYLLLVCTNQPDVARGAQTREQVEAFHALIAQELPVQRVYVCYHDNHHACVCRKPEPGMLLQAQRDFGVELSESWMVGDRATDIAAGRAAGCRTVFMRTLPDAPSGAADHEIATLAALLDIVR